MQREEKVAPVLSMTSTSSVCVCACVCVCVCLCVRSCYCDTSMRSYSLLNEIMSCQPSVHFHSVVASSTDDITLCIYQIKCLKCGRLYYGFALSK